MPSGNNHKAHFSISPNPIPHLGLCCNLSCEHWGCDLIRSTRGVGNERNLVHLVEKSVEIKLKS